KSNEVQIDNLLPGTYTVTEDTSKNPESMALVGKNGVEVTVEADNTADVPTAEFTNDRTEETVSIPVEKRWERKAGKSVTVKLLADGDVVREITLSASNNWKHVFADLPKHDSSDGHEIIYTVSEDEVAGYTTAISGDAAAGFVITNKETPPPPPDTGDHSDALLYFGMMFVSVMGIILALTGKRKKIRH
ncbi:MAG: Cna B-type domain-containing protein, partial [Firmicutes bacterium]|nr:Cna B-type domain-containing protein [Bacillota bacterium]